MTSFLGSVQLTFLYVHVGAQTARKEGEKKMEQKGERRRKKNLGGPAPNIYVVYLVELSLVPHELSVLGRRSIFVLRSLHNPLITTTVAAAQSLDVSWWIEAEKSFVNHAMFLHCTSEANA